MVLIRPRMYPSLTSIISISSILLTFIVLLQFQNSLGSSTKNLDNSTKHYLNISDIPHKRTGSLVNLVSDIYTFKSEHEQASKQDLFGMPYQHKYHNARVPRVVHEISLSDPLDCLSQIVCGLNTYPPRFPNVRTTTANDFAYLLKNVILRLKKVPRAPITGQPATVVENKPTNSEEEQNDDEDSDENEDFGGYITLNDGENDAEEDEQEEKDVGPKTKDQTGDIVILEDLHPPLGLYRSLRNIKTKSRQTKKSKGRKNADSGKMPQVKKKKKAPPTPLEKLRMETDIREKLRSDAVCVNGIMNHTCPFRYEELMVLTSGVLERQRVVSYSSNKILPVVGYLLKSRSLTQTLRSTFMSLEKINNVTIEKDKKGEPFTFNHVYDEIINGDVTGNGIMIVETKDDFQNSHVNVWEDDEFDEALKNPVVPKEQIQSYTKKKQDKSKETQESEESDEALEQEGIQPVLNGAFEDLTPQLHFPNSDDNDSDNAEESEEDEDIPLPQLYGSKSRN